MKLDGIDYLGLDKILKRGTGIIIEESDSFLFLYDTISEAYFLACKDHVHGMAVLDRHMDLKIDLLMVSDFITGKLAFEKYGFSEKLVCYQAAFYGKPSAEGFDLSIKAADTKDLPLLIGNYDLVRPDEMEKIVERGSMIIGYKDNHPLGFIGEHLEGSMGLLYIFPEYRRNGYAAMLERIYIAKTLAQGYIPFCQVEKENRISLALQRKLGLTISDKLLFWMWK